MSASISPLFALSSQGGGSTPVLQTKNVTLSSNGTVSITPDSGYDGLEQVNVTVSTRFKAVGGTIFYIDSSSTKTYKFYDSSYNEISSVSVGDSPAFYEELSEGNGKEKYYVYHDALYSNKGWSYNSGGFVYETIGTDTGIGTGKTNTAAIMAKDDGAYIATYAYGGTNIDTIWKTLTNMRESLVAGCSDWFVPSKLELGELRQFMLDYSGTVTDYFSSNTVYSSSENNATYIWTWDGSDYDTKKKMTGYFLTIRSF